jgi:hypothetical protein
MACDVGSFGFRFEDPAVTYDRPPDLSHKNSPRRNASVTSALLN